MRQPVIKWVTMSCLSMYQMIIFAQDSIMTKMIAASVQLDTVVIMATRQGFSVEDFIRLVQTDESLYSAFHHLRTATYRFETAMTFSDKDQRKKAGYQSVNKQTFDGQCRRMQVLSESAAGNFYKGRKLKHRYYTYDIYDRVFLTHDTVCQHSNPTGTNGKDYTEPTIERHISELKKLIFRPGERSNVPLIGRKTAIFSKDMIDLYDFTILSDVYAGIPVYVFAATIKDAYRDRENKTVFKELMTYFSKKDFQVMARAYRLSQKTAAYMFDVTMRVDLMKQGERYFPEMVVYDGEWDIPTRKKEIGTFTVMFSDFR